MKKYLAILLILISATTTAQIKTGIEMLQENNFAQLKGKNVGLITNATGVDINLKSTIDILNSDSTVNLVALYAPEHGVRGDIYAGDKVSTYTDKATGLKVFSLYGKTKKPTADMLSGIDILIYDIQDIGCRSYTFISTMGLSMQAAADAGIEFMVLDRPNPLGGNRVEGCLVEDGFYSFVSQFKIPYIYGLTPGELALFLNKDIKCDLKVVHMANYKRDMTYSDTGLPYIMCSPHIPQTETVLYYPATGIIGEMGFVSIGVGYTLPFQIIAAPFINAPQLCDSLNALNLPGVNFRTIYYKPFYSTFKTEKAQGVQIFIDKESNTQLTEIQFYVIQEMYKLYPEHKLFSDKTKSRNSMFDKVCGTDYIRKEFSKNYLVKDIIDYWNKDKQEFIRQSEKYWLYE